ncbi:MAG: lytic transglycosylase domain-containing protein [Chthonomonadales bacterium]|nr:lytic transglycosylase domain-containing protein [Chthonomonadales bacterium]
MRLHSTDRRSLLKALLPAAVLAIWTGMAAPAAAIPAQEYLALRRKLGYDRSLTYAIAAQDWTSLVGKVFELSGTLNGHLAGDAGVMFMMTMRDGTALTLAAPKGDERHIAQGGSPSLRVLVRIREGILGNIVPLETLAIADDGEIRYRERIAQEQEARAQARRQAARQQSSASYPVQGSAVKVRPMAGFGAGLSEMARKYLRPEAQSIYPAYADFISRWNKKLPPDQVDAITVSILYFADRHRVDPRLVVAMIIAESDFRPETTSHKGAMGLGQIMPDEARAFKLTNPYDPIQNVRVSVNMLRMKLDMYRERGVPDGQLTIRQIMLAMAAYNAGAGAVKKHGGIPPYRETQRYVQRVLNLYRTLCSG